MQTEQSKLQQQIKFLILFFVVSLIISGITAFPIQWEVNMMKKIVSHFDQQGLAATWFNKIYEGITETNAKYPFIAYGTDWLAFAHIVIGIVFIGPLRDPVKNIWVIEFGMIACVLILPLAFICGPIRGIPFFWTLIDCSFGAIGIIPLYICWKKIKQLEKFNAIH